MYAACTTLTSDGGSFPAQFSNARTARLSFPARGRFCSAPLPPPLPPRHARARRRRRPPLPPVPAPPQRPPRRLLPPRATLLLLFRASIGLSVAPTRHTLPLALSAASFAGHRHLPLALSLHAVALARNLVAFPHVANALVALYARRAVPDTTRRVFKEMPCAPDVISYNALALLMLYPLAISVAALRTSF
ncbi:hypothetical protein PVAP13_9KG583100 [Panicum virgatum]|uniref:Uncharacterized protein n=1 Tax=Panicum virgatum TaxID=38727 RepID=A0A8T0NY26_PANVG|nr:hypothetical protein PVAP13_9KG583100 [Panicum virgatum]